MVAGVGYPAGVVARIAIAAQCAEALDAALRRNQSAKLAVNIFLITMVTGLAEAVHFAERQHLDLEQFSSVLTGGHMASEVSHAKLGQARVKRHRVTTIWNS